jgi:hypothetical protein
MRYRGFCLGFSFYFHLAPVRGGDFWGARALVFLLHGATAGLMLASVFILVSPCAGRHSLSLLR